MWELVAIAVTGVGGMWFTAVQNRKRVQGWSEAATACGLQVVDRSPLYMGFVHLEARDGLLNARIEDARRKHVHTRITVSASGLPGSSGLRIRRETMFRSRSREVEIGDRFFDARFSIEGPVQLVAALLDEPTRSLLARLDEECQEVAVSGPEIEVELSDAQVPEILGVLMAVMRRFNQCVDVFRCLADNALRDPQAGVRLLNLRLLARELPGEAVTNETLRKACADPSPQVRLQAATILGGEGRDVLLRLAETLEDDECSAQAVTTLGGTLPFGRARDLLLAAQGRRRKRTARACLELLGRSGEAAAVDVLAGVLARESGEVASAAAVALGETGRGEAEPPLVQALRSGTTQVRAAAAWALGRVGSAAAVLPLKEAAESSLLDRELRRTARQAVAQIQARLPGASPGQLSLAGDEAGQLSLAEAEAGQLSLAEAEKPQRPERIPG